MQKTDHWNAQHYDTSHSFVSTYGHSLVDLLKPKEGETILDLGCGTGDLAYKLTEAGASITAIDQSEAMIQQAKQKYPSLTFQVMSATELSYIEAFDAVFSNAVLHWVKPPEQALAGIYRTLKPQGRFVAEFGGKGNVQQITDELFNQLEHHKVPNARERFPWYFPSIAEYSSLMEEAGFCVRFAQHYDRPTPLEGDDGLKNWISMFGAGLFEDLPPTIRESVIQETEAALKDSLSQNGEWIADYKRIRVIGEKI